MGKRSASRIILTGFSATGKSIVGRELARRLGWDFLDVDEEVVRQAGKSIPQLFEAEGEGGFRRREKKVIRQVITQERRVIATGGGAVLDAGNRELFHGSGMVLCLEARPETVYERLSKDIERSGQSAVRPLLAVGNPLERIRSLKAARQPYYALADFTIHTDDLAPEQVVAEALRDWQLWEGWWGRAASGEGLTPVCEVVTLAERYPVYVGWGLRKDLAGLLSSVGLSGAANIISDETVFSLYGKETEGSLRKAGYMVNSLALPPGEASKTLDSASKIYDFLVKKRVERGDFILSLGGGVIGDLAGFVAATFLRGLPLVHLPTSLVAMVDASIGGKVAVDHPQGKNLI
ncbi:MAG: Multifunctional fusion protein, partial [Dehalococcoidia bacterium]|nr:Multifunctional fusion protein [Dehalococcoidia bacterium]